MSITERNTLFEVSDDAAGTEPMLLIEKYLFMMISSGWHRDTVMDACNDVLREWGYYEEEKYED
jgi:hypothetical protein